MNAFLFFIFWEFFDRSIEFGVEIPETRFDFCFFGGFDADSDAVESIFEFSIFMSCFEFNFSPHCEYSSFRSLIFVAPRNSGNENAICFVFCF